MPAALGGASGDGELAAGTHVGEFVIESRLGRGAFGTVYKAAHPLIGKQVAVKILARKYSVDEQIVERFIAEARAVNQIGHRNIIDIFSFGELADGRRYYVMEYLDGETLSTRIERGPLALADALPILSAVGRALDAAHAKGIAHRDLKPENIFLGIDSDGVAIPKLLDFGIAKLLGPDDGLRHKTQTGAPIGTPYYMSPEQCRGKDVDHRTDYYAFGVLAYRVLTGVYPIEGDDFMTIMMAQLTETPRPPSSHEPALGPAVDATIAWLMQKAPAARPPDLATAIRAFVEAPPPPVLARPRRRWPWLAAGAAVVAIAVALVATRREEPAPARPVPAPAPSPLPMPVPVVIVTSDVTIHLTGTAGAEVLAGGDVIGTIPGDITLPRGSTSVTLTARAPGFAASAAAITPDHDGALDFALRPLAQEPARGAAGGRPHNPRGQLADPFGRHR